MLGEGARPAAPPICASGIGLNDTGSNDIVSNDKGLKDNKTTYGKQHSGKKCEKRVISFYELDITLFYIK